MALNLLLFVCCLPILSSSTRITAAQRFAYNLSFPHLGRPVVTSGSFYGAHLHSRALADAGCSASMPFARLSPGPTIEPFLLAMAGETFTDGAWTIQR